MGVTTQTEFELTRKRDSNGLVQCIMFYHKDGCPKQKAGGKCHWPHEDAFTNAEKHDECHCREKNQ